MAAKRGASKAKFSPEDIKRHTKKIKDEVEKRRKEHKGENFQGIEPEDIEKKLSSVDSPFIFFMGWSPVSPGATLNISMGVFNPDPVTVSSLYVYGFVGSGNADPNLGTFLLNVDERFPRFAHPQAFGLSLPAGASSPTFTFAVKIPSTMDKGDYPWNFALMRWPGFGVGTMFDRSVLVFSVV